MNIQHLINKYKKNIELRIALKDFKPIWLAMLLGLVSFIAITGVKILHPGYVDWLMEGDPATHWLGWQFFRNSPLLQWPIGANPSYGLGIGSSIVFSDSIPLLAFIFKPFSQIFPNIFQYIGIWILICFLLQSVFAWKLLSLFTQDRWLPLIGSAFFTIAPAALWRLHGHYALFGHWVVLAGLYLYLSKSFKMLRWIVLLVVSALIHAYLLVLVLTIWSTDLCQRILRKEIVLIKAGIYFIVGCTSTLMVMWAEGYFMLGSGVEINGFGIYRMNLLSLINPDDIWSMILPSQKGGSGDYEGFNYLGLGMIGLSFVAIYELVVNRNKEIVSSVKKLAPILILSLGLFLYAISNRIALGSYELFSYNLIPIAERVSNIFRVSGRFFWPVYYLIYLAIFGIIFSGLKRNIAIILCSTLLFVQCIDTSSALRKFREKFIQTHKWSSPMSSPYWDILAKRYKNIIFVLPHNIPENWMPLAYFASINKMAINIGYFARVDPVKVRDAKEQVFNSIINNDLSSESLYIFENDDDLWKFALNNKAPSDVAGPVDGFLVYAPKLGYR